MIMYFYDALELVTEALRFRNITKVKLCVSGKVATHCRNLIFDSVN